MSTHTLVLPLGYRRRRAFFLACITQQVKSASVLPELLRAAAALALIAGWGGLAALLVG